MRVLCLTAWCPWPSDNGAKLRAAALAKALAEKHEVTLLTFSPEGLTPNDVARMAPSLAGITTVHDDPFRYTRLPTYVKFASPMPVAFWRHPAMVSEFERLTTAQPFDLITAMAMPVAPYVLGRRRAPILLDVESSQTLQLEERYRQAAGRLARQRYKIAWRKSLNYEVNAIRAVQTATFVSQKEVDYYAPHLGTQPADAHRMAVVPNGVELQRSLPATEHATTHEPSEGSAGIIFNGALTYHANYDAMEYFLAEIYPRVRQAVPGASLTITGSTQGVALDALKTDESVHFSGYVDDVRRLVADADVCVTPLRRGGGTRLKILEAMAVGTPVVSTSKGCEGLDAQPSVHLLVGDDPQAFADHVVHLLNDAKARALISGQALRLVEDRYDWRLIGAGFLELAEKTAQSQLERKSP